MSDPGARDPYPPPQPGTSAEKPQTSGEAGPLWRRVQTVFEQISAAAPEDRAAVLDEACGDDAALRREVESLLDHDARAADSFLASPALPFRPADDDVPAWADNLIDRRIGRYTITRLIGHGGMGCVFEARQEHPARAVALKVLWPGFSAPSALARFRLEPEVLGRLQHPNIAQVYDAGTHQDPAAPGPPVPYFAMEYIADARSLIAFADAEKLSTRQRLELFAKVCDAVHHGHQKGIIHRDLKPANILVGADGEPKVIDFGVARASDADIVMTTQHTRPGDLIGTVHYMSPEQCDGHSANIDTRSDVYSLGVVVYELLTGTAPYDTSGTTVYAAIRAIKETSPRRPSQINRRLRGDVEAILLRALEKDPARRYVSAADLGQDIRRHLAGEPIEARRPTAARRVVHWLVRHPLLTTLAACMLILGLTVAASAIAVWYTTMRPDRVVIVGDHDAVQLRTPMGVVLHTWWGGALDAIAYAKFLAAPAAPSGGPLVIIGYSPLAQGANRNCFAFYDLNRSRERPYQSLRIKDDDVPLSLIERQARPAEQRFHGEDFGAKHAILADVFPEPDGGTADELVAVFQHPGVTHAAICVHRLDGTLLYRAWAEVDVNDLYWLAKPRRLVIAGVNGEAFYVDRFVESVPIEPPHPVVVFAIEPVQEFITRGYIVQEPDPPETTPAPLRPVWYYCVLPPMQDGYAPIPLPKHALVQLDDGRNGDESVHLNVRVGPTSSERTDPTRGKAGRTWLIDGVTGAVTDTPSPDVYKMYERTPDKPDNPLPPYTSWYLGELPRKKPTAP
ncbi:MAG: protein kinase [Phycisphaerae bacterium]|jgi:hypothetical protein